MSVGGLGLAVADHAPGREDLPTLVFVHANGFCGGVFEPLLPMLGGRFRPISFDQRGHGESDKPASGYDWQAFADDLAGLLDALDLRDVTVVGHSMGGAAAAGAAARAHGRIARAVLLDPVIITPARAAAGDGSNPLADGARRRRMEWESREAMLASLAERSPFADWRRDFLRAYVEHGTEVLPDGRARVRCPSVCEAQVYEVGSRTPNAHWLGQIDVPVLLVSGERSGTLPPDAAREAAGMLRFGSAVVLSGVGHFVPMQAPDRVVELLLDFCGGRSAAAGSGAR